MKVVLAAVGSRGDVQPLAVLAQALLERGHQVVMLGPPEARALAAGYGVTDYTDYGRDIMAWIERYDVARVGMRTLFSAFKDLVDEDLRDNAPKIAAAAAGADVIVSGGLELLGRAAADKAGAVHTFVFYSPHLIPSDDHAPIVIEPQRLPKLANRAFHNVTLGFFNRVVLPVVNRERRAWGLDPNRSILEGFPQHLTFAWDEEVAPAPSDLDEIWRRHDVAPRAFAHTGAIVPRERPPLAEDLAAFLDGGGGVPCVYVGFGSMPDTSADETLQIVDDVARDLGVNAVLLRGASGHDHDVAGAAAGNGSERVRVVTGAAHATLFPKMAAVVHHGGSGTMAQALRAGVPQVMVPHFLDQFFWAHRLSLLGVSAGTVKKRDLNRARLTAALATALTDDALQRRARALGAALSAKDAASTCAAHIEKIGRR